MLLYIFILTISLKYVCIQHKDSYCNNIIILCIDVQELILFLLINILHPTFPYVNESILQI